ncbi:hypothetical protein ACBC55_05785 [Klebsiella spallanzanii]
MGSVTFKARDLQDGNVVLFGADKFEITAIVESDFNEDEREYQFGESKDDEPFADAKKLRIEAMDERGETVTMIMATTDNVAIENP